ASHEDHKIVFRVKDTGIGVAPQHQEAIFAEFTQLENPLQAQHKGTGLGLPLCRSLAGCWEGELACRANWAVAPCSSRKFPSSTAETLPSNRQQVRRGRRSFTALP